MFIVNTVKAIKKMTTQGLIDLQNCRFSCYTGEYGSVKTRILAYLMHCLFLKTISNEWDFQLY